MTIFGWDMSHYDDSDIGDALSQGIKFITHKAGGDSNDGELNAWWNGVRNIGQGEALLGAYWVLYPGNASAKADAFLARLDSQCSGWRSRPFILQLDCEKWNNDSSTVPSKSDIKTFCDRLVSQMPKLRPIVYAPFWVYGSSLAGLNYPLWASSYVNGSGSFTSLYPGDSSSKWNSYSGQVPAILQYTSSASIGGQTTCDANAFRGTLTELTALVAPGWSDQNMAIEAADLQSICDKVWKDDGRPAPAGSVNSDGSPNTEWAAQTYLKNTYDAAVAARTYANQALAAVISLAASSGVDVNALAASVSAAVVPAVISGLQANGAVELTAEQVEAASEQALRTVLGRLDNQ
jgi:hypothetical protein